MIKGFLTTGNENLQIPAGCVGRQGFCTGSCVVQAVVLYRQLCCTGSCVVQAVVLEQGVSECEREGVVGS